MRLGLLPLAWGRGRWGPRRVQAGLLLGPLDDLLDGGLDVAFQGVRRRVQEAFRRTTASCWRAASLVHTCRCYESLRRAAAAAHTGGMQHFLKMLRLVLQLLLALFELCSELRHEILHSLY